MLQVSLCLAMYLADPDLDSRSADLTSGFTHPFHHKLVWQSVNSWLMPVTVMGPFLDIVRLCPFMMRTLSCVLCCHPQLLSHLLWGETHYCCSLKLKSFGARNPYLW